MTLNELHTLYMQHPQISLLDAAMQKKSTEHVLVKGLNASARAMAIAALYAKRSKPMLIALQGHDEAAYMQHDLEQIGISDVYLFPSSHRFRQKKQDDSYTIQRTEVLSRLSSPDRACVVVSYPEALSEPVLSQKALMTKSVVVTRGQTISPTRLAEAFSELGFVRVDFVYEPGQFAVRGGIMDVFSYSHEMPYRLDFFGDEIDSIRIFDVETQLSKEKVEAVEIVANVSDKSSDEAYLTSYLHEHTWLICDDINYLLRKMEGAERADVADAIVQLSALKSIEIAQHSYYKSYAIVELNTLPQPLFHKNFELLTDQIQQQIADGYKIYILSDSKKQTDRLQAIFDDKLGTHSADDVLGGTDTHVNLFTPVESALHEGFVDSDAHICVYTDHQIFERYHKVEQKADTARKGKVLLTLKELNQLQVGDYIVHVDHGIGQFGGLVRTSINGKPQEMIKLIYKGNDCIFVSIHSLHRISKYKGKDGGTPAISKLGSGQWERLKERTKQKVKDIARDLIKLYAARKKEQGFAFSADSYMQHELEASFLYEDTPDQAKATAELKHDMESAMPMDRLICGDVGFGKTELAMRAAFKAVCDSKQVAVLVPTTVLALQHYRSFCERFENFPVKVEYLSRAKTNKEIKEILARLEAGQIDVLIGTHKLVGKSVKWHDLGLLIIDEEQKFGVATKEKLRAMKVNVDTLTLTATPIPRTLQFSLLGARDLSIMTTPPVNRYPIQTEVITPADEDILRDAIRYEMSRNGQVFFIHNRVNTLDMVASQVRKLCPEARLVVAHGQMPPDEVEQILTDFVNYDYDVLIATSIIENGVDIPNANTIIISGAQHFGLSDLHQMRGRVGRSNKKAFCYLVAPSSELLTSDARRRLSALETFADLGSGFHIAMQDLDIRGAGNMLGAEQSGFIADLGYETYQKILNEAVLELKDEEFDNLFAEEKSESNEQENYVSDSQLESDLQIGFPETYVTNISERITLYRELDDIQSEDALLEYRKRLIDRFGVLPPEAEELLEVVRLRWLCMHLGIEKIVLKQGRMLLFFVSNLQSHYYQSEVFGHVLQYATSRPQRCQFREINGKRSIVIEQVNTIQGAYTLLSKIKQN